MFTFYFNYSDYDEFLDDLEEDPEYRKNVNIYRDASKVNKETVTDDEDVPKITLAEMLEDLHLEESDDAEMGEDLDNE